MAETARRTTLAGLTAGMSVDLEAALRLGERIGGHLLSGHVDAVGEVVARTEEPAATVITVRAPADVMACTVPQGSVAIDGISLTVVGTRDDTFTVSLIPHTLAVTVAGRWQPGDAVNLEADMLAKHVHHSVALLHQSSGHAGPHGTP
jgi:riboflavin synthase